MATTSSCMRITCQKSHIPYSCTVRYPTGLQLQTLQITTIKTAFSIFGYEEGTLSRHAI